jgi:uncharacterized protein (DUF305 family)
MASEEMATSASGPALPRVREGASWHNRWFPVTLAAIIVLVGFGVMWFQLPRTPATDSAEAGFLRDMTMHHRQAVEMAFIIHARTDDPEMQALVYDIGTTQQGQVGIMTGWLELWDLPQTGSEPPMAWMGHPVEGRMPGMAAPEEIQQLDDLPIGEAEILFLNLMMTHHQAGVEMAQAYLDRGDDDNVTRLAQGIVASQQGEIALMQQMLADRGAAPGSMTPARVATPAATPAHSH